MNKPKIKGTKAESAVVTYLREHGGFPHSERRALTGSTDQGDITGTPGLCWEVKAHKLLKLAQWMRETEAEQAACRADYGILVVKPPGIGYRNVGKWWTILTASQRQRLLSQALQGSNWEPALVPLHIEELSGSKLVDLPDRMKLISHLGYPMLGEVRILPRGSREEAWSVTHLDSMCRLLNRAGYGSE